MIKGVRGQRQRQCALIVLMKPTFAYENDSIPDRRRLKCMIVEESTYRLGKSPVLEVKPYPCFVFEEHVQEEEAIDSLMSCVQCAVEI